jgi:hypothetical protein
MSFRRLDQVKCCQVWVTPRWFKVKANCCNRQRAGLTTYPNLLLRPFSKEFVSVVGSISSTIIGRFLFTETGRVRSRVAEMFPETVHTHVTQDFFSALVKARRLLEQIAFHQIRHIILRIDRSNVLGSFLKRQFALVLPPSRVGVVKQQLELLWRSRSLNRVRSYQNAPLHQEC